MGDVLGRNDSRSHRVQVDIVHHAEERGGVFRQRRLVAPLKKMALFAPEAVETNGEGGLQPVHAITQVRSGRGQSQVEVISEDGERMHFPSIPLARLSQRRQEGRRGSGRFKNISPVISAIYYMINRPRILNAKSARHPTSKTTMTQSHDNQISPFSR